MKFFLLLTEKMIRIFCRSLRITKSEFLFIDIIKDHCIRKERYFKFKSHEKGKDIFFSKIFGINNTIRIKHLVKIIFSQVSPLILGNHFFTC